MRSIFKKQMHSLAAMNECFDKKEHGISAVGRMGGVKVTLGLSYTKRNGREVKKSVEVSRNELTKRAIQLADRALAASVNGLGKEDIKEEFTKTLKHLKAVETQADDKIATKHLSIRRQMLRIKLFGSNPAKREEQWKAMCVKLGINYDDLQAGSKADGSEPAQDPAPEQKPAQDPAPAQEPAPEQKPEESSVEKGTREFPPSDRKLERRRSAEFTAVQEKVQRRLSSPAQFNVPVNLALVNEEEEQKPDESVVEKGTREFPASGSKIDRRRRAEFSAVQEKVQRRLSSPARFDLPVKPALDIDEEEQKVLLAQLNKQGKVNSDWNQEEENAYQELLKSLEPQPELIDHPLAGSLEPQVLLASSIAPPDLKEERRANKLKGYYLDHLQIAEINKLLDEKFSNLSQDTVIMQRIAYEVIGVEHDETRRLENLRNHEHVVLKDPRDLRAVLQAIAMKTPE